MDMCELEYAQVVCTLRACACVCVCMRACARAR